MTDGTQKKERFKDRISRLMDENDAAQQSHHKAFMSIIDSFNGAAEADRPALTEKLEAASQEGRRLSQQMRDLREQERNPPWTPLTELLRYASKYKEVEKLLADGTMIKMVNDEGVPILAQSCYAGDERMAMLLIARGADVNMKGEDDLTPLHYATFKDNVGIVKKLLKAGADINARTTAGDGIRDIATYNDAEEVLKLLDKMDRQQAVQAKKKPAAKAPKPK